MESSVVHEFRRFIQQQMDLRNWTQAELARQSGLSRQQISRLLADPRPRLARLPEPETITGLANAFVGVSEKTIRAVAAKAAGAQIEGFPDLDLEAVSSDLLLAELQRRLRRLDAQDQQEPRPQEGSAEHGSAGSGEGGSPAIGEETTPPGVTQLSRRTKQGRRGPHEPLESFEEEQARIDAMVRRAQDQAARRVDPGRQSRPDQQAPEDASGPDDGAPT